MQTTAPAKTSVDTLPTFPVRRTPHPRPRPPETELGFGKYFTDHMFLIHYDPEHGWHDGAVVPYGPLSLDPAAAVFHYGQALFEGLKAFRAEDGRVHLFRADRHAQRIVGPSLACRIQRLEREHIRVIIVHALAGFFQVSIDVLQVHTHGNSP